MGESFSPEYEWLQYLGTTKILIQKGSELIKSASLDVPVPLTRSFTGQSLLPNRNLLLLPTRNVWSVPSWASSVLQAFQLRMKGKVSVQSKRHNILILLNSPMIFLEIFGWVEFYRYRVFFHLWINLGALCFSNSQLTVWPFLIYEISGGYSLQQK